jgi:N-acetylglucosaminyldiphosphoundecaprenol N-acetyl-beta-D-mannosaminyltransferase
MADLASDIHAPGPTPALAPIRSVGVVGTRVDATSYEDAASRIVGWARDGRSASVCVASVNNVMEARDDPSFRAVMGRADLVTPDGMPLVWSLRLLGVGDATRVAGADLVPHILERAAASGVTVGFFGGTDEALADLRSWAEARFPDLVIGFSEAPPFRARSAAETTRVVRDLVRSGTRILFVGLGCPTQEIWMDGLRGRAPAVTVGVGAAFDFLSGRKRRAPVVLQRLGLEWIFRLVSEPRRLWRRYLRHNPRFVGLITLQVLRERRWRIRSVVRRASKREERS